MMRYIPRCCRVTPHSLGPSPQLMWLSKRFSLWGCRVVDLVHRTEGKPVARSHYVGVVRGIVGESSGADVVMDLPDRSVDAPFLHAAGRGPWACSDSAEVGSAGKGGST